MNLMRAKDRFGEWVTLEVIDKGLRANGRLLSVVEIDGGESFEVVHNAGASCDDRFVDVKLGLADRGLDVSSLQSLCLCWVRGDRSVDEVAI